MGINLDDSGTYEKLDQHGMGRLLVRFPSHILEGVKIGESVPEGLRGRSFRNVVVTGLGGSAIVGDILKSYLAREMNLPIEVNRNYELPPFAGPETLLVSISYSGDTEETLSATDEGIKKGCGILSVSSGGKLEEMCKGERVPFIKVPPGIPPRCALGYLFFPTLRYVERMGLVPDHKRDVDETVGILQEMVRELEMDVPEERNPAKGLARSVFGRIPLIYGTSGINAVAAYRWKTQFNENSKSIAFWGEFPELNHNEIEGWINPPEKGKGSLFVILLVSGRERQEVRRRYSITGELLGDLAAGVREVGARGSSSLARLFSHIIMGDFVSYYLSILYGVDPTPVEIIGRLKERLAQKG